MRASIQLAYRFDSDLLQESVLSAIDDIVSSRDVDVSNSHYRASAMVRASYGMPRISDRGLVGLAGIIETGGPEGGPGSASSAALYAGGGAPAASLTHSGVFVDGSSIAVDPLETRFRSASCRSSPSN